MPMHPTNKLLKYLAIPIILIVFIVLVLKLFTSTDNQIDKNETNSAKNLASIDNSSEALNTLTAELSKTKQSIMSIEKDNDILKQQNNDLLNQLKSSHPIVTDNHELQDEVSNLKNQLQELVLKNAEKINKKISEPMPIVHLTPEVIKPKIIPFYTIPANGTSVRDKLMTALVGRIPVKGVVTDPYPFKVIISNDNLAASGLRIPHLAQMIVSGYCEGDLNLISVRGWVTSLTFVFQDGTISTTSSNDNDLGNFTKANSLGYLSDEFGNPFIRGKLITNAPTYLASNIGLGAAVGAANAYTQTQLTNNNSLFGNSSSMVTGSPAKFIFGHAATQAATDATAWWHDRIGESFDAIYVAPTDEKNQVIKIAVNFAKEIHIDYDPQGRKISYAQNRHLTALSNVR